ncbi:MAG: hybrid sensor histidine kinase/response regulator, partial [bacterium]|nr:hybrid sensor histidine kinase/response regulator [bacterium]
MDGNQTEGETARAAVSRRANTRLRFVATLTIALILHVFIGMSWVWIWAALYILFQTLELWLTKALEDDAETRAATWRRRALTVAP